MPETRRPADRCAGPARTRPAPKPRSGNVSQLLLFLLLAGCGGPPGDPEEQPYVRGPIEALDHRATASGLLVLAGPGSIEACGIRATADAGTVYQRRDRRGTLSGGSLADLTVGDTVEVYVDGPVAESCPVQGRAARIVELAPLSGF